MSATTTPDIYTHITGDIFSEAAAKIGRSLSNEVAEYSFEVVQNLLTDFHPVMRYTWKPRTSCITELNEHRFECCCLPTWAGRHQTTPNASTSYP